MLISAIKLPLFWWQSTLVVMINDWWSSQAHQGVKVSPSKETARLQGAFTLTFLINTDKFPNQHWPTGLDFYCNTPEYQVHTLARFCMNQDCLYNNDDTTKFIPVLAFTERRRRLIAESIYIINSNLNQSKWFLS